MSEILHQSKTNIGQWGNSLGVRIKKIYAELAGMNQKNKEVTQAVIKGQHGIFIAHWIPEDQPDLQDINQEKLEKLLENAKTDEEEKQ